MFFKIPFSDSRQKERAVKSVLCILLLVIILSFSFFRTFDTYENLFLDWRFKLRPNQPQSEKVVIIEVSDDTLKQLGYWPIPRDFHASLIDVLSYFGVKQIMFDFIFTDPTDKDEALRESIQKAKNIYLPYVFHFDEMNQISTTPKTASLAAGVLPILEKAAKGTGFINSFRDNDGKTRHIPLFVNFNGVLKPHIALRMFCDYTGIPLEKIEIQQNAVVIDKNLVIPTSRKGIMLVNYAGNWHETFRHFSYVDILAAWKDRTGGKKPRVNLDSLKDSICFVGLTATGTPDLQSMPLQNDYPMAGLHANVFNSLLLKKFVYRANKLFNLLILCILLSIVFVTTSRRRNRPVAAFCQTVGYSIAFLLFSFVLFFTRGLWIDVFCPIVMMLSMNTGLNIYNFIEENKKIELVEKELSIAKKIQESFLPSPLEKFHHLEIASHMLTAKHVGGDLYDMQQLSRNQLGIFIGDVSGKGVPAALVMAKTISLFRMLAFGVDEPSDLLFQLNEEMYRNANAGIFVTATYLIYNTQNKNVMISSAGHLPTFVVKKGSSQIIKIEPKEGMPLGITEKVEFSQDNRVLEENDRIVLYTDGIIEAKNLKREDFGEPKFISLLHSFSSLTSKDLIDKVEKEIQSFVGKAPQHDDCTLIILKELKGG